LSGACLHDRSGLILLKLRIQCSRWWLNERAQEARSTYSKGKEPVDGAKKEHHTEDKKDVPEGGAETIVKNHGDEINLLKIEIESRGKTINEYLNQIKRTQADFENYRRESKRKRKI